MNPNHTRTGGQRIEVRPSSEVERNAAVAERSPLWNRRSGVAGMGAPVEVVSKERRHAETIASDDAGLGKREFSG